MMPSTRDFRSVSKASASMSASVEVGTMNRV